MEPDYSFKCDGLLDQEPPAEESSGQKSLPGLQVSWSESLWGNHPGQLFTRVFCSGHPWQIGKSLVLTHLKWWKAHPL